MKIYKMDNCPHCEKVDYALADKYGAEIIDIHSEDYGGFVPEQVPALQAAGLTLMGPSQINAILNVIDHAKKKK